MGGNNVKGLFWMETIYPSPNGQSIIAPELLQKEIQKGTIVPPNVSEGSVDGDMDDYTDKIIQDVWRFYDPKGTGILPKKILEKFFKDALEVYSLRLGRKSSKEVMGPGVSYGQAMTESVGKVTSNNAQVTQREFEDFINCYDLEEALGSFLGVREVTINSNVEFVDTRIFKEQAAQPKKVVYREYPDD